MKSIFRRVLGFNLLIMLLLAVGMTLPRGSINTRLEFIIGSALIFALIFTFNLGLAIFSTTPEARRAHWLSLLLVLLIGFGTCAIQMG
jgi:hypothetical protein